LSAPILLMFSHFWCGPGGSRTHVRTRKPYAFYTFIPDFGFRMSARPGPPTDILSSKSSSVYRGIHWLFPIEPASLTLRIRNNILGAMSRSAI